MEAMLGISNRLLTVLTAGILLISLSLSATGIDGPPPWDDEHTAWVCIDAMVSNYCEEWEETTTGWECTNAGHAGSYCEEWEETSTGWECTNAGYLAEECEGWTEKANGWECTNSMVSNYCEKWEKTSTGWKCTNAGHSGSYCEAWEKTSTGWKCTNAGHTKESCEGWSGIKLGWPEGVSLELESCSCYGETLEAYGSSVEAAEYQCGAYCGGLADCGKSGESCDSCCNDEYCNNAGLSGDEELEGCGNSCKSSCGSNRFVHDLIELFVALSLLIAALVLAGCGLKFITSDEPASRTQAKKCIAYVIAALILLGIAGAIVGVFY